MSYNNKYNTRNSGRFYNTGQFVSGGELIPGANPPRPAAATRPPPPPAAPPAHSKPPQPPQQSVYPQQQQPPPPQPPRNHNLQMIQTQDVEMKSEKPEFGSGAEDAGGDAASEANGGRPRWMRSKLAGVKKVSNKERRRRQNETLRRLLTPKNALMVLNEMLPNEQLTSQFKVEPAGQAAHQYYGRQPGQHSFCADLTLAGNTYKGYGDNKMTARNAAAEQAIRDLIIKKMSKLFTGEGGVSGGGTGGERATGGEGGGGGEGEGEEGDEEALPMIQLASFALHKLFSEWEYEGHKVPQLKPTTHSTSDTGNEGSGAGAGGGAGKPPVPPKPRAPRKLPVNAAAMHPSMLLSYMRSQLEYRELAVEGNTPQTMVFTLGVDVDGATYIGKATNKKEARKQAAKAACQALFNVRFDEVPTANAPVVAE